MKTALMSLLAVAVLGAAAIVLGADSEPPADTSTIPTESVSVSDSLPESEDMSDSASDSGTAPDSGEESGAGAESDPADNSADGDTGEDEMPPADENEAAADTEEAASAEEFPAEEPTGIVLSDEYAAQIATNQADSIMGFHGMERNAGCTQSVAVLALSDYAAATGDEAYFKVWEAVNAVLVAQAANGVTAANCAYENGSITILV